MNRLIISTVGTSLLTNQINRGNEAEKNWYPKLRDTANLSLTETPKEVIEIIETLAERANEKLRNSEVGKIRAASAELNGVYGLYEENLQQGKQDLHYLIATDTAQGTKTAEIVESFLREQGLKVDKKVPPGLSTASTRAFADGIDDLISWLRETVPPYRESQYKVYFNLVGSFKSLQGYMNTIGMFYADEIIYIFEGQGSQLITIPRLPINVDNEAIAPYKLPLALMDAGAELPVTDKMVRGIPESLVFDDGEEMTLSTWGKLIWSECREQLLRDELLPFPRLEYLDLFAKDYKNTKQDKERVKLQETLAKVSQLLQKSNGNPSVLKEDGGLQYDKYTNKGRIDHFRVTDALRVSCEVSGGKLILRHYGAHDYVNKNP